MYQGQKHKHVREAAMDALKRLTARLEESQSIKEDLLDYLNTRPLSGVSDARAESFSLHATAKVTQISFPREDSSRGLNSRETRSRDGLGQRSITANKT